MTEQFYLSNFNLLGLLQIYKLLGQYETSRKLINVIFNEIFKCLLSFPNFLLLPFLIAVSFFF
jgi:hypothetical protein